MGEPARIRRATVATAAAAALALAGGAPAGAGSSRTVVKASNFDFSPQRVTVQTGTRVVWKELEGRHTVTSGRFDEDFEDGRVKRVFKNPGVWRYHCRFHRDMGMKGKVVVE